MDLATSCIDLLLVRIWRFHRYVPPIQGDEQLGLIYVGTSAKAAGYKCEILDRQDVMYSDIVECIINKKVRAVGFYCDHENVNSVCKVSKLISKEFPELILLAGGPQATSVPEYVMNTGSFDALVCGEGEEAIVQLLDYYFRDGQHLKDIPGIWYTDDDGNIRSTSPRPVNTRLDDLPLPDRSLNPAQRDSGSRFIMSGRGCPFRCAFCVEGTTLSRQYRYRSAASVLSEVDDLIKNDKLRYILFMDDTFIAHPQRVREICEGLKKRIENGADFRWYCEARVDILEKHPDLLPLMKDAGLMRIQIGIESGNQKVLDAYKKEISVEQIRSAVKAIADADIPSVVGNFIIGGAFEDNDTLADTRAFMQELYALAPGRFDYSTTLLTPYPGTDISRNPEHYGLNIIDPDCLTGEGDEFCFVESATLNKWQILDARSTFEEMCNQEMERCFVEGRIPDYLIQNHIWLYHRYHMLSKWFQLYSRHSYLTNFFGMLLRRDYSKSENFSENDFKEWHPVRTYQIGTSRQGRLILKLSSEILELDDLGSFIYQYCSGRNTLSAIASEVGSHFFPDKPVPFAYELTKQFVTDLESKYLVVWSRI